MSYTIDNINTTANLKKTWSKIPGKHQVISFYSEKDHMYGCFSNFYLKFQNGVVYWPAMNVEYLFQKKLLCYARLH